MSHATLLRCPVVRVKMVHESMASYKAKPTIDDPSDIPSLIVGFLEDADRENFVVVCLDAKNRAIAINTVHIGTINMSVVGPQEVFKPAILANATCIIVAHNHPSGDCTPSPEDIEVTRRLYECGRILSIPLVDHIIVGFGQHCSFRRRGIL